MPVQRGNKEAVTRFVDSSILIPATILNQLKGSTLQRVAFDGLRHIGSASFAALAWAKEKKCLISN